MPDSTNGFSQEKLQDWLGQLATTDQEVFKDIGSKMAETPELGVGPGVESLSPASEMSLETIVARTGRPVLPIRDDKISTEGAFIESDSIEIVKRMRMREGKFAPLIPSVGRIDIANSMFSIDWIGTGWLIDSDIVVTNRHVADLIAGWDGARFAFRPGKGGRPLGVTIDFKHEVDNAGEAAFEIEKVLWIERNPLKADIALLKLKPSTRTNRIAIPLAANDATATTDVVVVGYPARSTPKRIPDQELMEKIFAGRYNIKRIAPGKMGDASVDRWSTHDCTTLGGNSGSVVLDMNTGQAVALHFAGAFLIENYAVPVSVIHSYLRDRVWERLGEVQELDGGQSRRPLSRASQSPTRVDVSTGQKDGSVELTIPLHLSISLGKPVVDNGTRVGDTGIGTKLFGQGPANNIESAVEAARAKFARLPGVMAVRRGYLFSNGEITKERCVVVAAEANAIDRVRSTVDAQVAGFPVDVRPASIEDIADHAEGLGLVAVEARSGEIGYDDDNRTGAAFSLEPMEGEMSVTCHVGPERSWAELETFINGAQSKLIAAMYEFNAKHVADGFKRAMERDVRFDVTLDGMLANRNEDDRELFNQGPTFRRWERTFDDRFAFVYVPEGVGGLIWQAYHIKVAVRDDGDSFWLSSGNWKPSSQPKLTSALLANENAALPGNREWHVVVKEQQPDLARRFQSHIEADFKFTQRHADRETISAVVWVDVPIAALEAVVEEGPPLRRRLPSQTFSGSMKVHPLLTPDRRGAAFCKPVLKLIRSARTQLWFQIPYITPNENAPVAFLDDLIKELVKAADRVEDFRLILRADTFSSLQKTLEALQEAELEMEGRVKKVDRTHTKGMIVDSKHVLIGSHNWSGPGVSINRDASLIFFDNPDIAAYYKEAFDIDWQRASEPRIREMPEIDIRLATTEAPPPGYRRVPLEAIRES